MTADDTSIVVSVKDPHLIEFRCKMAIMPVKDQDSIYTARAYSYRQNKELSKIISSVVQLLLLTSKRQICGRLG